MLYATERRQRVKMDSWKTEMARDVWYLDNLIGDIVDL